MIKKSRIIQVLWGGGIEYLKLIKELYILKRTHQKQKILYKQITQIFPELAYIPLKDCKDYKEALKLKLHLCYFLGEALIKTHKNWYKGSYLFLFKEFKQAKNNYTSIKEFLDTLSLYTTSLNPNIYENILNHIDFFTNKNYQENFHKLISLHKDYESLMNAILNNLDFVIKHFETIKEWLSSNEFKTRYRDENHPYPSLLDPNKLKDINEELNYHSIDANLAWELNLPLPDNYKFVYWCSHGTGGTAFLDFLSLLNISCVGTPIDDSDIISIFKNMYNFALNIRTDCKGIALRNYHHNDKFYFLLPKIPGVHIVRDPISMLKHYLSIVRPYREAKRYIKLDDNFNEICDTLVTIGGWSLNIDLPNLTKYILAHRLTTFHDAQLQKALVNTNEHFIIDMNDIVGSKTPETFKKICEFLSIDLSNRKIDWKQFERKIFNKNTSLLPLTLNIGYCDLFIIDKNWIRIMDSKIKLWNNWFTPWKKPPKGYCIEVTNQIIPKHKSDILDNIALYIEEDSYDAFLYNINLKKEIEIKIIELINSINKLKQRLKDEKMKETDVIRFMKENKTLRLECKKVIDEHLSYIKTHRPDIVKSWKYYKEFEKMCEELDGGS